MPPGGGAPHQVTTLVFISGFAPDPPGSQVRHNRGMATLATPRACRPVRGRVIGGVCAGLADNLGWPVAAVRMGFVALSLLGGFGVVAYAAYWAVLPACQDDDSDAPRLLAFAALLIGAFLLLLPATAPWWQIAVPLALMALGANVVWTRLGATGAHSTGSRWITALLGGLLVLAGLIGLAASGLELQSLLSTVVVGALLLAGAGLIAMPWIAGLYRELISERQERIRSQARAELATQVHDSVLQTLTLIRRHADDPDRVVRLARAEERHLRSWLYDPVGDPESTLAAALAGAAARVEQDYPVTVELVCVGDAALDERSRELVAAAGEAMLNAAKHAGGAISVYAETDTELAVYVRDRGPGFDPDAVPADRHGISASMRARMQRIGGECRIRTSDRGTEVTLTLPEAP